MRLLSVAARTLLIGVPLGCGAPRPEPVAEPAGLGVPPTAPEGPALPGPSGTAPTPPAPGPPPIATALPSPACPPAGPPPKVSPPEAKTAQPSDGVWVPLGDPARHDRAAEGSPVLFRTVLHPHPQSRFISVTIAAVDLCRTRIAHVPGSKDVEGVAIGVDRGLVPAAEQAELIAVFNGGWKPEHGRFGMYKAGVSLVPARPGSCTISLSRAGAVGMSSAPPEVSSELDAYRQTPPCLFENGALHPRLAAGDERPWGGRAKDVVTRRRSGVGVDASGRFLFYAVGEEASPRFLAKALLQAGAVTGAELDINWYWTRFLLFGGAGKLEITSTLIPGMEFQRTGYVERPSERDFFYVLRRADR